MDVEIRQGQPEAEASSGDRLVIDLEEGGTTGYQWVVDTAGEGLVVEESTFETPASGAPGAAGRRRIVLRATRAGTARVALRLRRPWENTDAEGFDVTVHVK